MGKYGCLPSSRSLLTAFIQGNTEICLIYEDEESFFIFLITPLLYGTAYHFKSESKNRNKSDNKNEKQKQKKSTWKQSLNFAMMGHHTAYFSVKLIFLFLSPIFFLTSAV